MPLYVVLYAFLILVFNKRYIIYISIVMFLNLFGLLFVELWFSEAIGTYPDINTRVWDNYIGLMFSLLVIYSFIAAIKKNYIHEYERAKMSDQLKSAFVANMSHEIRTPLNAIVGFSSLMTDPDIEDEDKKSFEDQIQRNSDYLLSLIEDIIDVSKIESNQLTIKVQEVDVVPLIKQITQSFQLTIPSAKNINITNSLSDNALIVMADKVRVEQILRNLLSNAVKFTDKGTIDVGCSKDREFFTFSVKDTGIGIHTEHQQIIFERFRKLENSKQHLYRGTGIGLFLSKQLVEMFGGKIWVESEVGKGSIFYFTIPA
ncbi:MAG: HAMP domain-containing histidine kinase [Prolixibacteraceae bacterium]|nr:HAMP domain-containing histidine kinase [Prolixibacteraceae bacterium]